MARTHIVVIGPYRDMCNIARITKLLSQVKIHTFVKSQKLHILQKSKKYRNAYRNHSNNNRVVAQKKHPSFYHPSFELPFFLPKTL
jgi:hypothetical protein